MGVGGVVGRCSRGTPPQRHISQPCGPGRRPKPALLPADGRGVWGAGQRCLWGDATGQCHHGIIFPSGKGNLRAQLLPKRTGALSAGGTRLPTPATPRAPGSSVSWEQVSPSGKDSSDLLSLLTPESSTLSSGKAIMRSPMLALCLHSTGPLKAGVTQTPRHPIKAKGQQVTLRCSPISGSPVYVGINRPQVRAPRSSWSFMKVCKEQKETSGIDPHSNGDDDSKWHVSSLEPSDWAVSLCASNSAQPCGVTSVPGTNLPASL